MAHRKTAHRKRQRKATRFRIEYTPEALEHLKALSPGDQRRIQDGVDSQLAHEPTTATRNRKLLRANPVAPWELRIATLRVYFDVIDLPDAIVTVRAVGRKVRSQVQIGGEEVDLG